MIKEAINKIQELVLETTKVEKVEIEDSIYLQHGSDLTRYITPQINTLDTRSLSGLNELVRSFVKVEAKKLNIPLPLVISARGNKISVHSSVDNTYQRQCLIECLPIIPDIITNRYVLPEEMIINLNTCYETSQNKADLIDVISNLYNAKTVKQIDNGIGKKIVVESDAFVGGSQGVTINPLVNLTPIATYQEIEQVERQFNLRVDDNGRVALFTADEGYFEKEVQERIGKYLFDALTEEIGAEKIILGKDVILAL